MTRVFINGSSGTTGLRLRERLRSRSDVTLLDIDTDKRKDPSEIKRMITESDVTFLCLPDDAAREAVTLAKNARIIDTSTAHRISPDWVYGFPELSAGQRGSIKNSARVSVPGCHASGFIALVFPLVSSGIIANDYPLSCLSVTGYSGGGKSMIAEYEHPSRTDEYSHPRQYAFNQNHKHLPEMTAACGLESPPVFTPVVGDFYSGMLVTVPLYPRFLPAGLKLDGIRAVYSEHYADSAVVKISPENPAGFMDAGAMAGRDGMEIFVAGNDERIVLIALYDNLGKGASGAALQCFNLMTGTDETTGLVL